MHYICSVSLYFHGQGLVQGLLETNLLMVLNSVDDDVEYPWSGNTKALTVHHRLAGVQDTRQRSSRCDEKGVVSGVACRDGWGKPSPRFWKLVSHRGCNGSIG